MLQWLTLLEDTVSGLPQYVCTREGICPRMKRGMMTEQFDMSDELGGRGDAPEVSASWPETCVLLSYGELPSVYVDARTRAIGVFDQIAVSVDWRAGTLRASNPTSYLARVRIQKSDGDVKSIALAPSEVQIVRI